MFLQTYKQHIKDGTPNGKKEGLHRHIYEVAEVVFQIKGIKFRLYNYYIKGDANPLNLNPATDTHNV